MKPPRFQIEGTIAQEPYRGQDFVFATLRYGDKLYFDLACFEDGPLERFRSLQGGEEVEVIGRIGKKKVKGSANPVRYEIQLIATRIELLSDLAAAPQSSKTAPRPSARPAPSIIAAPPSPAPEKHPAQHDVNDDLLF